MTDSNMVSGEGFGVGITTSSTGSDIPQFSAGMDTTAWRNSIFRWAMSKRGGAHKALNKPPIKESFWVDQTKPMIKSEITSFELATKEFWANSCFIYSSLENSFKGNHAAMEYYLLLHQKNLDAGVTEQFEASKLLDKICHHFKDTSETLKTKLSLEFSSFKVKENESIEVYATRFERLIQHLGLVSVVHDDAIVQSTFKAGLVGPEFIFVQTLLMMKNYKSFEKMKKSIIAYSKSPAAQTLRAQALQSTASAAALPVTTNTEINLTEGGRKRQRDQRHRKDNRIAKCYICGSKRHMCANCPERKDDISSEDEDMDDDDTPVKKRKSAQKGQKKRQESQERPPILSVIRSQSLRRDK
jgi:hypothetical protein